jgi:protein TonB
VGSAPSFGYGSASTQTESSGINKKVFIGIAAAVLVAVAAYFGLAHFKGSGSKAETTPAAVTEPVANPQMPKSSPSVPAANTPAPTAAQPEVSASGTPKTPAKQIAEPEDDESDSRPSPNSAKNESSPSTTKSESEKPESNALVVKGGKAPSVATKSAPAPDAPPPSMIGMATPSTVALPNLGTSSESGPKPVLQTLSISQGVSQGLLYKKVAPTYPPAALRMRVEGVVELQATISKQGDISKVKVISGDAQLAKAASDAVKQWKYKPYLLNGEPVEIQTGVTINFKLPR